MREAGGETRAERLRGGGAYSRKVDEYIADFMDARIQML